MITRYAKQLISSIPGLQQNGLKLSRALHSAVLGGGQPVRKAADVLHGTWLGHPLHPVLTDFVIGAWGLGALFDAIAAVSGTRQAEQIADALTTAGTAAAVPTLLSGLTDYSTTQKPAVSTATLHALLNDINFVLYLFSVRERRRGNRARGVFLSSLAMALTLVAAWLGGHLVYGHKVGVDHSQSRHTGLTDWTPALDAEALPEGALKRASVEGNPVLLYRQGERVHAIGAVCSHAGGPLEQGTLEDGCFVRCPWHDSVFDLRNGRIKHGPAVHAQPRFEARIREGRVEVRQPQHHGG